MAWEARPGLKLGVPLQWHFSKGRRKPAHLEAPKKPAATSGELAKPQPFAPTRQWSDRGWEQDAGCSCGCGSADAPARHLWGRATHDEPLSGQIGRAPCREVV